MRLEWALKATVRNLEFMLVVIRSSDWRTLSQGGWENQPHFRNKEVET